MTKSVKSRTFTRDWLDTQIDLIQLAEAEPLYLDSTTHQLDALTRAARLESQRKSLALKIAIITLIPTIFLVGVIGASIIAGLN